MPGKPGPVTKPIFRPNPDKPIFDDKNPPVTPSPKPTEKKRAW